MALLLLIVIGAIIGWLASIIARVDNGGNVLPRVMVSTVAAVTAGTIASSGSILGAVGSRAVFLALAASVASMLLYEVIVKVQSEI